jgi:hypothetical protein
VDPVRSASVVVDSLTAERHPTSLTIYKDTRAFDSRFLAFDIHFHIDVNELIEGLQAISRYNFMEKAKTHISANFQGS